MNANAAAFLGGFTTGAVSAVLVIYVFAKGYIEGKKDWAHKMMHSLHSDHPHDYREIRNMLDGLRREIGALEERVRILETPPKAPVVDPCTCGHAWGQHMPDSTLPCGDCSCAAYIADDQRCAQCGHHRVWHEHESFLNPCFYAPNGGKACQCMGAARTEPVCHGCACGVPVRDGQHEEQTSVPGAVYFFPCVKR